MLIVGPGGGQKLAAHSAAIGKWLAAGGRLLAIGLDQDEANAFLVSQIAGEPRSRAALLIAPDSPTQRVGAPPLDKFEKVRHREPMLSLDNAFTYEELREFDKRVKRFLRSEEEIEYTVEPKYDGLAMELSYRKGLLHKASTRGDGYEGEDVTRNIRTIRSVPLKIGSSESPDEIDIRGEVYMNIKDFEALNTER